VAAPQLYNLSFYFLSRKARESVTGAPQEVFPLLALHLVSVHVSNHMTEMQFPIVFFHARECKCFWTWSREQKRLKRPCILPSPIRAATECGWHRCNSLSLSSRADWAMQPRPQSPQEHQNPVQYIKEVLRLSKMPGAVHEQHFQPLGTLYSTSARHCSRPSLSLHHTESS
jgi:hypothetical protein